MKQMDFDRVREVFLAARDLDGTGRADVLLRECRTDTSLRVEVESLLAHHDLQHARVTTPLIPGKVLGAVLETREFPEEPLPRGFGGFHLLEVIGRGGMGTVYRARQHTPDRMVALKVIRPGMMTASMLERFRHEADLLARLQHPGIAQIFEAGAAEQAPGSVRQPYFAMEFVSGRPIDVAVREPGVDVRARLQMIAKVCDAVQHAHQKGVIHRDLKPANILVDADGQPRILDFGVARATDADVRATLLQTTAGQLLGTLPYMSPEQVSGDPQRLDTRSDVYTLGVLTFEVLTGALPHDVRDKSFAEALLALRDHPPSRLGAIAPALRGDLDTIVGKALEKDPARRYESAAALAEDVRRYLAYQPIIARPPSAIYQMRLFARRHRALVTGAALALAALILGAGISLGFAWHSQRAAQREARQRDVAERTSRYLTTMLSLPDPHHAGADMTVGQMLDQIIVRLDSQREMPEVEAEVRSAIGTTYMNLRESHRAVQQLTRAVDLWRTIDPGGLKLGRALIPLGVARLHVGDEDGSEAAYREAIAILRTDEASLTTLRGGLVDMLIRREKYAEAAPLVRDGLAAARERGDPVMLIAKLRQAARVDDGLGEHDSALHSLEEALSIGQRLLPETHPLYYNVWLDLSRHRHATGDFAGALAASGRAYELSRRATKPGSNDWTGCLLAHLAAMEVLGRTGEMRAVLTEARTSLVAASHSRDHVLVKEIDARLTRLPQR